MYWFSHISVHTTYLAGLLGPSLVTGAGLGMLFVPLSLVVLTGVRDQDSGLASSLLNTGQQVGGAIGLAALGTVAWTTVANSARSQIATAGRGRGQLRPPACQAKPGTPLPASIYHNALAAGISRGLLAASGIALVALIIAAMTIRVRREDLTGGAIATAQGQPASAEPGDGAGQFLAATHARGASGGRQHVQLRTASTLLAATCTASTPSTAIRAVR